MDGKSLKILVVHAHSNFANQLQALLQESGHRLILATNVETALAAFSADRPDLVCMDSLGLGGEAQAILAGINAIAAEQPPAMILQAPPERLADILTRLMPGMRAGCRAATRPIRRRRARSLASTPEDSNEDSGARQTQAREQEQQSSRVMAFLTHAAGLQDPMLHSFNLPAETFSGDLLCAARSPDGTLQVLLADASGHGLPAALTALPMTQIFYGMSGKGFPLASIAAELNRKLQAILPVERFVAATLAAIDVRNQSVEVWNGGNPEALYIDAAGQVLQRWPSRHPPLGILDEAGFSPVTETLKCDVAGELVLCSDGLVEAQSPAGQFLGLEGLARLLRLAPPGVDRLQHVRAEVQAHLQTTSGRDDISCILVRVPVERRQRLRLDLPPVLAQARVGAWSMQLTYSAQELRYLDVVPALLAFVAQLQPIQAHRKALYLVISELFNNALDHGLLGLDSALKNQADGFERYLNLRRERLTDLGEGHITLGFRLHQEQARAMLDIFVQDSGPGFDYRRYVSEFPKQSDTQPASRTHGRGIALVRGLCSQVEYAGCGNQVRVRYVLGALADRAETVETLLRH